ncbi:hypothetical protein K474DRAFT_1671342 [Panus rudis PR-1116 ss-1]|nr:hypothetical protein K474DRAFT_1671342 [Panus rudis PR-1116 ss-1]
MDGMDGTTDHMEGMMTPWLHFVGGDYLLFKSWHPSSPGAIAGACIGLALLALLERWLSGVRAILDRRWKLSALAQMSMREAGNAASAHCVSAQDKDVDFGDDDVNNTARQPDASSRTRSRVYPPFILSHDVPRGIIHAIQALLAYVLMLVIIAALSVASAHFQLQYPVPRGPFVEPDEVNFCDTPQDGYNTAASNRSEFPLSGGFISLNSEHPKFTVGLIVSTAQNPNNFANFSTAVNFFQSTGEGPFCFPVDLSAAGISGVGDGANATLQVVFDGGDGKLYQCADVTLSSNFNVPSNVSCSNSTGTSTSSGSSASSTSPSGTSGGASPTGTANSATSLSAMYISAFLSVLGAALVV